MMTLAEIGDSVFRNDDIGSGSMGMLAHEAIIAQV